jgi:hypothetical protein
VSCGGGGSSFWVFDAVTFITFFHAFSAAFLAFFASASTCLCHTSLSFTLTSGHPFAFWTTTTSPCSSSGKSISSNPQYNQRSSEAQLQNTTTNLDSRTQSA